MSRTQLLFLLPLAIMACCLAIYLAIFVKPEHPPCLAPCHWVNVVGEGTCWCPPAATKTKAGPVPAKENDTDASDR